MWSILTTPGTKAGGWQADDFFETGRREIADVLRALGERDLAPPRGRALDFGCGIGRLTQALAAEFDEVVGVDIAPSMIEMARHRNTFDGKVTYLVNTADHLPFADSSFDFVYSSLVLQHIRPEPMLRFVTELTRVLTPDGVAALHIPCDYVRWREPGFRAASLRAGRRLKEVLRPIIRRATVIAEVRRPRMEMNAVPPHRVEAAVRSGGGAVAARLDSGAHDGYRGYRYVITRS